MFDPYSLAFQIKNPFSWYISAFDGKKYYNDLIRIWHHDPCKDGSDNSCDWYGSKKPLTPALKEMSQAIWHLATILDNSPFYPDHEAHLRFQPIKKAMWDLRKRSKWRIHPRWHFWHWRVTVVPLQNLKRWLFTRCSKCGGRFKYGESGTTNSWNSAGPRWFKSEDLYHNWHDGIASVANSATDGEKN